MNTSIKFVFLCALVSFVATQTYKSTDVFTSLTYWSVGTSSTWNGPISSSLVARGSLSFSACLQYFRVATSQTEPNFYRNICGNRVYNQNNETNIYWEPGEMSFHPGYNGTQAFTNIVWTCPTTGSYQVSVTFRRNHLGSCSTWFSKNGVVINNWLMSNVPARGEYTSVSTQSMVARDTLRFTVGGSFDMCTTGIDVEITFIPPPTVPATTKTTTVKPTTTAKPVATTKAPVTLAPGEICSVSSQTSFVDGCKNVTCFSSLGVLGSGFDITSGSLTSPVIEFSFSTTSPNMWDGFTLPDQVSAIKIDTTVVSKEKYIMKTAQDVAVSFSAQLGINIPIKAGSFNIGPEVESNTRVITSSKKVIISEENVFKVYALRFREIVNKNMRSTMLRDIRDLPEEYNAALYRNFIQTYGTHYTTEVVLGGRIYIQGVSDVCALNVDTSNTVSLELGFDSIAKGFGVSGGFSTTVETKYKSYYSQTKFTSIVVGGQIDKYCCRGSSCGIASWQSTVTSNPKPIKYAIAPLSLLFSYDNTTESRLENFERAVDEYLQDAADRMPKGDPACPTSIKPYRGTASTLRATSLVIVVVLMLFV